MKYFKLPKPKDRFMGPDFLMKYLVNPKWRKEDDDTYILYLVIRISVIIMVVISSLYICAATFSFPIYFYFFIIDVNHEKLTESITPSYGFLSSFALLLIVLPYVWLLTKVNNIDWAKIDLLHWNEVAVKNTKRNIKKIKRTYRLLILICVLCMVFSGYSFLFISKYFISEPITLFSLYFLISIYIYPIATFMVTYACLILKSCQNHKTKTYFLYSNSQSQIEEAPDA